MNPDFLALLSALNDAEVRYLVVGGYAMAWYGHPRATGDLDLWVETNPVNAKRLLAALSIFGSPLENLSASDFEIAGTHLQIGLPPVRVDLLTELTGLQFEPAWLHRLPGDFGGVPVQYLALPDFITNKAAVGRARDLADIEAIQGRL